MTRNVCVLCKREWTILAAYFPPGTGPFHVATTYACVECYPQGFDHWVIEGHLPELIGADS